MRESGAERSIVTKTSQWQAAPGEDAPDPLGQGIAAAGRMPALQKNNGALIRGAVLV